MTLHSSGSDVVLSSMKFMQDGTLTIENNLDLEDLEDGAVLAMTQNFILYALDRDDWISTYLTEVNQALHDENINSKKPFLKLIKGGLEDC